MKKYIIIALISVVIGGTSVYATQKLNLVWEYFPDGQSVEGFFSATDQVKVFKFTDNKVDCYVAMSPANYLKDKVNTTRTFNSSISCVK